MKQQLKFPKRLKLFICSFEVSDVIEFATHLPLTPVDKNQILGT